MHFRMAQWILMDIYGDSGAVMQICGKRCVLVVKWALSKRNASVVTWRFATQIYRGTENDYTCAWFGRKLWIWPANYWEGQESACVCPCTQWKKKRNSEHTRATGILGAFISFINQWRLKPAMQILYILGWCSTHMKKLIISCSPLAFWWI